MPQTTSASYNLGNSRHSSRSNNFDKRNPSNAVNQQTLSKQLADQAKRLETEAQLLKQKQLENRPKLAILFNPNTFPPGAVTLMDYVKDDTAVSRFTIIYYTDLLKTLEEQYNLGFRFFASPTIDSVELYNYCIPFCKKYTDVLLFSTYSTQYFEDGVLPFNIIVSSTNDKDLVKYILSDVLYNLDNLTKDSEPLYYKPISRQIVNSIRIKPIFEKIVYIYTEKDSNGILDTYSQTYGELLLNEISLQPGYLEKEIFKISDDQFILPEKLKTLLSENPVSGSNFSSSTKTMFIINSHSPEKILRLFDQEYMYDNYFIFGHVFSSKNYTSKYKFNYAICPVGNYSFEGYKTAGFIPNGQYLSPFLYSICDVILKLTPYYTQIYYKYPTFSSNKLNLYFINRMKEIKLFVNNNQWYERKIFTYYIDTKQGDLTNTQYNRHIFFKFKFNSGLVATYTNKVFEYSFDNTGLEPFNSQIHAPIINDSNSFSNLKIEATIDNNETHITSVRITFELNNDNVLLGNDGLTFNKNKIVNDYYKNTHIDISQFDGIPLSRQGEQFMNLSNLKLNSSSGPSIFPNTSMTRAFYNCTNFNNTLFWDFKNVVNMDSMFENATKFRKAYGWRCDSLTSAVNFGKNSSLYGDGGSYLENAGTAVRADGITSIETPTKTMDQSIMDWINKTPTTGFFIFSISNLESFNIDAVPIINKGSLFTWNAAIVSDNTELIVVIEFSYTLILAGDGFSFRDVFSYYGNNKITILRFGEIPVSKFGAGFELLPNFEIADGIPLPSSVYQYYPPWDYPVLYPELSTETVAELQFNFHKIYNPKYSPPPEYYIQRYPNILPTFFIERFPELGPEFYQTWFPDLDPEFYQTWFPDLFDESSQRRDDSSLRQINMLDQPNDSLISIQPLLVVVDTVNTLSGGKASNVTAPGLQSTDLLQGLNLQGLNLQGPNFSTIEINAQLVYLVYVSGITQSEQDLLSSIIPIINDSNSFTKINASTVKNNSYVTVTVDFSYKVKSPYANINGDDGLSFKNIVIFNNTTVRIMKFGGIALSTSGEQFKNIGTLEITAPPTDVPPNIFQNTSLANAFSGITNFNSNISTWKVNRVTNMSNMFSDCSKFNQNISAWDVSNVTNMSNMFSGCSNFNQNISAWKVNRVTNMSNMFENCSNFNQNISAWDVSKVTDMTNMFNNATKFNNTSKILNWNCNSDLQATNFGTGSALYGTGGYTADPKYALRIDNISSIETPIVLKPYTGQFKYRFDKSGLQSFDINKLPIIKNSGCFIGFDQSDVTSSTSGNTVSVIFNFTYRIPENNLDNVGSDGLSFVNVFSYYGTNTVTITQFGGIPLSKSGNQFKSLQNLVITATDEPTIFPNTSLAEAFNGCTNFNQNLSTWNVSNVTNMSKMFQNCSIFNQNLTAWNVSNVTNMSNMFYNAAKFNNTSKILNWNCNSALQATNFGTFSDLYGDSIYSVDPKYAFRNDGISSIETPIFLKYTGSLKYNFVNDGLQLFDENKIPIINTDNTFKLLNTSIEITGSTTNVTIQFSYVINATNNTTNDGLSFKNVSSYYKTNMIRITDLGGIPLSKIDNYRFLDVVGMNIVCLSVNCPFIKDVSNLVAADTPIYSTEIVSKLETNLTNFTINNIPLFCNKVKIHLVGAGGSGGVGGGYNDPDLVSTNSKGKPASGGGSGEYRCIEYNRSDLQNGFTIDLGVGGVASSGHVNNDSFRGRNGYPGTSTRLAMPINTTNYVCQSAGGGGGGGAAQNVYAVNSVGGTGGMGGDIVFPGLGSIGHGDGQKIARASGFYSQSVTRSKLGNYIGKGGDGSGGVYGYPGSNNSSPGNGGYAKIEYFKINI
jgi:surface protein